MEGECEHQKQRGNRLYNQPGVVLGCANGCFVGVEFHQDLANSLRQLSTVVKDLNLLQQHTGDQASDEHGHSDR